MSEEQKTFYNLKIFNYVNVLCILGNKFINQLANINEINF
jgi:hypothetical protein